MKELIEELKGMFSEAKALIKGEIIKSDDIVPFVLNEENKEVPNPNYVKPEEHAQIVAFDEFVEKHPELSDEELNDILKNEEFSLIEKLTKQIDGFLSEVRRHNPRALTFLLYTVRRKEELKEKEEEKKSKGKLKSLLSRIKPKKKEDNTEESLDV